MKKKIFLRGSGGVGIGWGHMSRLLSLREILEREFSIIMVVTSECIPFLERAGLQSHDFMLVPATEIPDFYVDFGNDVFYGDILVLDGYNFSHVYHEHARNAGFKLVLIDDFAHGYLSCDLIINHAPGSAKLYEGFTEIGRCCCGIDYALLRREFYYPLLNNERDLNRILLSMGGTDPAGLSSFLLQELIFAFPGLIWDVVITSSFREDQMKQLVLLRDGNSCISLHQDLDAHGMRMLMLHSGWALLSSSTVTMEAWASGLFPAIICYTENQRNLFRGAVSENMAFGFDIQEPRVCFSAYLAGSQKPVLRGLDWNPAEKLINEFKTLAK